MAVYYCIKKDCFFHDKFKTTGCSSCMVKECLASDCEDFFEPKEGG
jgi:methionyl-tRNA synthetase